MQLSDLGPESSTIEIDLEDDFKMISNSSEVTEGTLAAVAILGSTSRGSDRMLEKIARRWLLTESMGVVEASALIGSCVSPWT